MSKKKRSPCKKKLKPFFKQNTNLLFKSPVRASYHKKSSKECTNSTNNLDLHQILDLSAVSGSLERISHSKSKLSSRYCSPKKDKNLTDISPVKPISVSNKVIAGEFKNALQNSLQKNNDF